MNALKVTKRDAEIYNIRALFEDAKLNRYRIEESKYEGKPRFYCYAKYKGDGRFRTMSFDDSIKSASFETLEAAINYIKSKGHK